MTALFRNFVGGILGGDLLAAGTTMTSLALGSVPVITAPDTMTVVLDPDGLAGAPEIVLITAHALDSPTATIVRAQEGTVARDHLTRTDWVHGLTAGWATTVLSDTGDNPIATQTSAPPAPGDYELWLDTDEPTPPPEPNDTISDPASETEGWHVNGSWVTCWKKVTIDLNVVTDQDFTFPADVDFDFPPPVVGHRAFAGTNSPIGATDWELRNPSYKNIVLGATASGWRHRNATAETTLLDVVLYASGPGTVTGVI